MDLTFKYRIIVIESLNTNNGDSLTGTHLFQNILQRLPSKFPYIEPSFYTVHSLEELHKVTDQIKSIVDNGDIVGQRRNSVAELSEDDRQTVHEEWQI